MRIRDWSSDVCSSDLGDVVEDGLRDEVVEVDPHPAGLDPLAAVADLPLELVRGLDVDADQPVPVRTGTRAAAARLDPRSEERRVGEECVSKCRSRGAPIHKKKNEEIDTMKLII